jgi:glycosyltransferase involved in cell wall biosynthesis
MPAPAVSERAATPVVLIEPHSGGRISGGYLYNIEMARHERLIVRRGVRPSHLAEDLEALELLSPTWVLADSLFLTPELMPIVEHHARRAGHRIGVVLHAFPSFIRRAEDRERLARSLPLSPSAEELDLLERLDLLVAPGPYIPRLLAECGCPVRTAVCAPGVESSITPPRRRTEGRVELISIGSVTPLKGFLDAAEALARSGAPDFQWTIVGHLGIAPDYVARLRERAAALGLGERIVFAGQLDHDQTLAALAQSDLLLLSSFTENHPLVALEATQARVPTVGYAVGGLPDIVRHQHSGLLSPLLDIGALAKNLGRAIGDDDERQRLSNGCADVELLSWAEAARRFVVTLQTLQS